MSIRTSVDYSSVILNQNQPPADSVSLRLVNDETWYYQTFLLPSNLARGADTFVPDLSGFQIFCSIPEGYESSTSFEWTLERRSFGVGWTTLRSGRTLGVDDSGHEVWITTLFDGVSPEGFLDERYRIGIKSRTSLSGTSGVGVYDGQSVIIDNQTYPVSLVPNTPVEVPYQGSYAILILDDDLTTVNYETSTGIDSLWYSTPNPLAEQFSWATDSAENPLMAGPNQYSFGFRVLGLTADEGVDFLGNRYRSAVRTYDANSTNSVNGDPNRAWMSKPNPSRFAVESLYFDVRPRANTTRYGAINYVHDPNGEGPLNGFADSGGVTHESSSEHAVIRTRSLKVSSGAQGTGMTYWDLNSGDLPDFDGQSAYLSFYTYHPSSWTYSGPTARIGGLYQVSGSSDFLSLDPTTIPRDQWIKRTFHLTNVDPTKILRVAFDNQGVGDVYYGGVMLTVGDHNSYADGGYPGWEWSGVPHDSDSVQVLEGDIEDELAVIDRVFIDPMTPGIWCSIYYSYDGSPGTNDEEWDNREWRRVNASYNLKENKAYVLPEPVLAKYIKLEFTHLQPQQYSPGDFAQPIRYKKHPRWILEYFMARLESDRQTTNQTVANKVGVVYDALDLLYNYYLDDLGQEPLTPAQTQPGFNAQATFEGIYDNVMDIEMVNKISTAMRPYSEYATKWGSGSLLGEVQLLSSSIRLEDYPFEKATNSGLQQKTDYSALRNSSVAFESDYPVMFFFLNGKHEYRSALASFSYNRAYFAGIKEVAFLRDQYTPSYDTNQYIENGGDTFNAERSEFAITDGKLTIPE